MDCFEFSLRVGMTELSDVANFWGAQCLVEDERLLKHVISGGSTTWLRHINFLTIQALFGALVVDVGCMRDY